MTADFERRRVLVVGTDEARRPLMELFAYELFNEWEALEADSFQLARFVLQHECCDVLLVDEALYQNDDSAGLAWLGAQQHAPVLFLADVGAQLAAEALEHGANQWLPRGLALSHPPLLASALHQMVQLSDLRRRARLTGEALRDSRRQVSRLVGLLWEASPVDARTRWFTQRHMMQRLEEEVARSERHGTPLSVVLGEVDAESAERQSLASWTAERISRAKRRHDVAGQYGPHGFMLLLSHTSEAGAVMCCRRMQTVLQHPPLPSPGVQKPIQTYFGIAAYSESISTPQGLLGRAEERLENARVGGAALAMA
jgi:GGDEF domain-containing protein